MPTPEKINAQKSFSSQRPWCGLRLTIRTRQPNVFSRRQGYGRQAPLHLLPFANPNPSARIQGAEFITKQVSSATQSDYGWMLRGRRSFLQGEYS